MDWMSPLMNCERWQRGKGLRRGLLPVPGLLPYPEVGLVREACQVVGAGAVVQLIEDYNLLV